MLHWYLHEPVVFKEGTDLSDLKLDVKAMGTAVPCQSGGRFLLQLRTA